VGWLAPGLVCSVLPAASLVGGIEKFSSASSRASIFVSTIAVRVVASSCTGVIDGGPGGGICVDLPLSGHDLKVVGGAEAFFLRWGVGEGSTRAVVWEAGVGSRPCGAGEVKGVCFTAREGLTLVALGVEEVEGVDGTIGTGFGIEPEAEHFLLAVESGIGLIGIPPCMTCRPSLSAVSMK
jgi:hypothetical protein